ncbi:hypothetical protein ABIE00_002431 [Arthrobacter sp. OAP107]
MVTGYVRLTARGESVTSEVVAAVWHKWSGDPAESPNMYRFWRP